MHLRLLLVEDDLVFEKFVRAILEEDVSQIHHAKNMAETRMEIATHNFDVIVLDLGLPDSKRPETVRAIPEIRKAQPEAVILVASVYPEYKEPAINYGADGFLFKDATAKHRAMITAIYALMANKKATPEQSTRLLQNVAEG